MASPVHPSEPALLAALARRPSHHVPVWFMRQAGRSLPEYRAVRGVESILAVLENPELAATITLQPVERYGVDAAILYSDIMAPLATAEVGVDIVPGLGPTFDPPIRSRSDLARLDRFHPEALEAMATTVRLVTAASPVPLIGFAGGPFTVASYLIEGRPSRDYSATKRMMLADAGLFADLLERLTDIAAASITVQVEAGAMAVQIFDSWAGALSGPAFRGHIARHLRRLASVIGELGVPSIYFSVGTAHLETDICALGFDAVGIDWRVDLEGLATRHGNRLALQGNLDPAYVLAPADAVLAEARAVLAASAPAPGYVFNLGHGVLPESDPEVLARIVDLVHDEGARLRTRTLEASS